ncbi:MAG: flagellar hook-basal body complex protein [Candidatus Manganitrophus sp.]|nr:flagellar hook-basal body complex protein [Candidatus Manganitrophus sp.]WDT80159.1 MAG: flagellar hook-basal body complex protein [Candidatus Manganitrophus sp.]
MDAIYPVLSGALAQEKRLEVITNNLANVNTAGFKKDHPLFEGIGLPPGLNAGPSGSITPSPTFEILHHVFTDFSSGPIRMTGEPLDIAIEGEGFFSVQTPGGFVIPAGGASPWMHRDRSPRTTDSRFWEPEGRSPSRRGRSRSTPRDGSR